MIGIPTMLTERAGATIETASNRDNWYAIQVKRYEEHRVVRHLALKPVPTFLPFIEARRRNGARGLTRLEPLFPGYLFVQMPAVEVDPKRWHVVRWTPGVQRILGTEDMPVPMPIEAIEAIRARISELGFVRPGARFSPGARVRICSGPLARASRPSSTVRRPKTGGYVFCWNCWDRWDGPKSMNSTLNRPETGRTFFRRRLETSVRMN